MGRLPKTVLVMSVATLFGALGDASLSRAMKEIGDVTQQLGQLGLLAAQVIREPWIWVGVAFLALFLVLWLAVLSWADLSVALPLTALTYVFGALLAKYLLGEELTAARWAGTALVVVGVVMVAQSMKK